MLAYQLDNQFHFLDGDALMGEGKMASISDTHTVGKFQDFSVLQILREINFGKSRSSKIAVFAILGALNFVNLVNFSLEKVQNS